MRLLSRRFARAGHDFVYSPISSRIRGYDKIFIGNRVFVGPGANFSVHERLEIQDDVLIGPDVMILSGNHQIDVIGQTINASHQGNNGICRIEQDVWIGARVIVLGDVTIGEGAVVGAGSLVIRDVPPYTVVAGSPCALLRRRFSDDDLREHLRRLGRDGTYNEMIARRDAGFEAKCNGRSVA